MRFQISVEGQRDASTMWRRGHQPKFRSKHEYRLLIFLAGFMANRLSPSLMPEASRDATRSGLVLCERLPALSSCAYERKEAQRYIGRLFRRRRSRNALKPNNAASAR